MARRTPAWTLIIAGLVCGLWLAQAMAQPQRDPNGPAPGGGPGGGRRPRRGPPPHPLMTALDTDQDGVLSAEEIAKAADALKQLDEDKDGTLSRAESGPRFGPSGGSGRRPGGRFGRRGDTASFDATTLPHTEAEKRILEVLADMRANQSRGMMNVPRQDGRLLRLMTEAAGAKHVVEIGTSNGYSGLWLCLALRTTGGKLTTYEIDTRRAALARDNFKRAGVTDLVTLVEGNAHEEVPKLTGPIDLIFLDADKEGYLDYLDKLLPRLRPGGLILAHNMNPRQADPRYTKAITTRPDLETLFLHMDRAGVGVTLKKRRSADDADLQ